MCAALKVLEKATTLLEQCTQTVEDTAPSENDIRAAFIWHHARYIQELAKDALALAEKRRLASIYLLARPALESLFKMTAAVKDKDFALAKLVYEIEEEKGKIKNWRLAASQELAKTLDELEKQYEQYKKDLITRYGNPASAKQKIWEVANSADMKSDYIRDYFIGSKHIHGMLSAITVREAAQLYIPEALFRLTASVIDATVQLIFYFLLGAKKIPICTELLEEAKRAQKKNRVSLYSSH
jgi:hypothetical protein